MTTWNAADKTANITLSGGSLIATASSATIGGVRATTSAAAGKVYYEAIMLVATGTDYGFGWANSTAALTSFIGNDKNGVACFPAFTAGAVFFNNINQNGGTGFITSATGLLTICIAFDIGGKLFWARTGAGPWNNSFTADPGAGTGGISVATINTGPYFPVFGSNSSGASAVANFGATDFGYAVPSGFTSLDANAQAYEASSKFLGYAALDAPQAAVASSKFLAYDGLDAPQTGMSSSKFLAYVVLRPNGIPWLFSTLGDR